MGDPENHVMARPLRAPLRRSFSDHIRDSTARALDAIWKNTRERRLAGERHGGEPGINQKAFECTDSVFNWRINNLISWNIAVSDPLHFRGGGGGVLFLLLPLVIGLIVSS